MWTQVKCDENVWQSSQNYLVGKIEMLVWKNSGNGS